MDSTSVAAAAELGRRAADSSLIRDDIASDVLFRVCRDDERLETLDLERWMFSPRRATGMRTLFDPGDFARCVSRLAGEQTTIAADQDGHRLVAVINDHGPGDPGWQDHQVRLILQPDPDWAEWITRSGELGDQHSFATFLDDHATDVVSPDAATMREVAMHFTARRNASFDRKVSLTTTDVAFSWVEESKASTRTGGEPLEVPREFIVRLAPYLGSDPVELTARLCWDISREGVLAIGFRLRRPDVAQRFAFDAVCEAVRAGIPDQVPLWRGQPPAPLPTTLRPRG